jgi:hypothetical protein
MNESLDPLESELSALRPLEMSPESRRDLAQRLAEVDRIAETGLLRRRWPWKGLLVGGLIAASVAVILFRSRGNRPEPSPIVPHHSTPSIAVTNSGNSLMAYERAFARSPDEFAALLDRDAATVAAPNPRITRNRVFSWSDPDIHALLGEE